MLVEGGDGEGKISKEINRLIFQNVSLIMDAFFYQYFILCPLTNPKEDKCSRFARRGDSIQSHFSLKLKSISFPQVDSSSFVGLTPMITKGTRKLWLLSSDLNETFVSINQ